MEVKYTQFPQTQNDMMVDDGVVKAVEKSTD